MWITRGSVVKAVFVALLLAPIPAAAGSVALVLDASGSMNVRLPEGRTRIEAAKLVA